MGFKYIVNLGGKQFSFYNDLSAIDFAKIAKKTYVSARKEDVLLTSVEIISEAENKNEDKKEDKKDGMEV